MTTLLPVDRVEIQILVDNATDGLSTTPPNVETEFAFATRRGMRASSGRCLCCAVHGLSCLITVHSGDVQHTVLFDSGPEDYAFERNTTRLGADLGKVEGIVLSHGHWDARCCWRSGLSAHATVTTKSPITPIRGCFALVE